MAAMIFKAPPQFGQRLMSISKTRFSSRAQLMRGISPLTLGLIGSITPDERRSSVANRIQ